MTAHTCHAVGCDKVIPPRLFMCLKHWRMVPPPLQREIWRTYRPGQEIDKRPSAEYMVAFKNAQSAVAAEQEKK